jgi:hypothetical protein
LGKTDSQLNKNGAIEKCPTYIKAVTINGSKGPRGSGDLQDPRDQEGSMGPQDPKGHRGQIT